MVAVAIGVATHVVKELGGFTRALRKTGAEIAKKKKSKGRKAKAEAKETKKSKSKRTKKKTKNKAKR